MIFVTPSFRHRTLRDLCVLPLRPLRQGSCLFFPCTTSRSAATTLLFHLIFCGKLNGAQKLKRPRVQAPKGRYIPAQRGDVERVSQIFASRSASRVEADPGYPVRLLTCISRPSTTMNRWQGTNPRECYRESERHASTLPSMTSTSTNGTGRSVPRAMT